MAPVEIEWPHRAALAKGSGANDAVSYEDLLRAAASGRYRSYHQRFLFGSVGETLAAKFGKDKFEILRVEAVGPRVGQDLRRKAILAVVFISNR